MKNFADDTEMFALQRIDRARAIVWRWVVGIAAVEGVLLIAFALLADFTNRTHLLLFLSSILIYGTIGLSIAALASYVRLCSLRVVSAIESLHSEQDET